MILDRGMFDGFNFSLKFALKSFGSKEHRGFHRRSTGSIVFPPIHALLILLRRFFFKVEMVFPEMPFPFDWVPSGLLIGARLHVFPDLILAILSLVDFFDFVQ